MVASLSTIQVYQGGRAALAAGNQTAPGASHFTLMRRRVGGVRPSSANRRGCLSVLAGRMATTAQPTLIYGIVSNPERDSRPWRLGAPRRADCLGNRGRRQTAAKPFCLAGFDSSMIALSEKRVSIPPAERSYAAQFNLGRQEPP